VTKTFGSSKAREGVAAAGCEGGAGVGVAGTAAAAAVPDEPAIGGGGGAGVAADLAAGVAGCAAEEEEAAAGLGYWTGQPGIGGGWKTHALDHAHYEALFFDFVKLNGVLVLQNFAWNRLMSADLVRWQDLPE
jgi:hypothetical protein